jgi:LPPG:FO 2-phospho-L-lactate transferase
VCFDGADAARPSEAALAALADPDLAAIVIAPSNPWLSVDPILAVPGMREALLAAAAPVVAVTPLPGGRAIKGPTAKLMGELGIALTAQSIADHYEGVIDGLLIDHQDPAVTLPFAREDTIMDDLARKQAVAAAAVRFAMQLKASNR